MDNTKLIQIYNTLSTIETHGDGTLKMAACLEALGEIINPSAISNDTTK